MAEDAEQRAHYLGLVRRRLERITRLIYDLRELAVAEQALTREDRLPIRTVIQRVFRELHPLAKRNRVHLGLDEPLAEIDVDPARVEVALMNLVGNAVKYADPDKSERWVRVSLHTLEQTGTPRWEVHIKDNGVGIPAGLEQQIFQRRVRAHPGMAEGSGLGLAIVKEIMDQRGGAVRFESTEGEGTTFILELTPRLAQPEMTPADAGAAEQTQPQDDEGAGGAA